jgi:hypothetical protein
MKYVPDSNLPANPIPQTLAPKTVTYPAVLLLVLI